jgi:hypothetical protein
MKSKICKAALRMRRSVLWIGKSTLTTSSTDAACPAIKEPNGKVEGILRSADLVSNLVLVARVLFLLAAVKYGGWFRFYFHALTSARSLE